MKNKFNLIIFTAVFSLSLMYLIVPSYVYDEVMKEIPIKDLATYVFLGLFFLSLFIIKAISKKVANHGKMLGICLVLWGICVTLIPTLSINLFLMLSPLTKINTHSLNLTYTVAGLSALVAIGFAGVVVSLYNLKSTFQQNKLDFMIVGVCGFIGSLVVYYVVPNILSYDLALYLTGGLLFVTAIVSEGINVQVEELDSTNSIQVENESHKMELLTKSLVVLSGSLLISNFDKYFILNGILSKNQLTFTLVIASLASIVTLSIVGRKLNEKVTKIIYSTAYLLGCLLVILNIHYTVVILGVVMIVVGFIGLMLTLTGSTKISPMRLNIVYTLPISIGYFASNYLVNTFGELVSFTERRFYFIPPVHIFIVVCIIAFAIFILNILDKSAE